MSNIIINLDKRALFRKLSRVEINILLEILMYENNNLILLSKDIKEEIASNLDIKVQSVSNGLHNIVKQGLVNKVANNIYSLNKEVFKH